MSYVSKFYENEPIIVSGDEQAVNTPLGFSRGLEKRNLKHYPIGGLAKGFDIPTIPRSEWSDRIESLEKTESRISDVSYFENINCQDQESTNYCWANAPVYCVQLVRMLSGLGIEYLSPASVAAPIKNFTNRGGFGSQALEYIIEKGIVPSKYWPENSIDKKYLNDKNSDIAKNYVVTEWYDLEVGNFEQLMTCLLLRIPVAVGYLWWGHEVSAIDPISFGEDKYGIRIRNSWGMSYGKDGYAILAEKAATPDDAVAPRVIVSYPHNA